MIRSPQVRCWKVLTSRREMYVLANVKGRSLLKSIKHTRPPLQLFVCLTNWTDVSFFFKFLCLLVGALGIAFIKRIQILFQCSVFSWNDWGLLKNCSQPSFRHRHHIRSYWKNKTSHHMLFGQVNKWLCGMKGKWLVINCAGDTSTEPL